MISATVIDRIAALCRIGPIYPGAHRAGKIAVLSLLLALISGCVSNNAGFIQPEESQSTACLRFYQKTDRVVFTHDAEDSGEMRIAGYPFLRGNRFLASFRNASLSTEAFAQWLEQLRRLDAQARILEFANLPPGASAEITALLPAGLSFRRYQQSCGRLLVKATLSHPPENTTEFKSLTAVADDYQTWQRIVGAYPVARLFAHIGIEDLHRELNRPFQEALEQIPLSGELKRYRPHATETLTQQDVEELMKTAYLNPLRLPLLKPDQLERLFDRLAPIWEVDTRNDNDLIGAVTLDTSGNPKIDTKTPTVYVRQAYTRYRGDNLLQLIYQIWLPAREKTGCFDLYGGDLDSVIWRVTLDRQGVPIAYDSIHACGCYYLLFPGRGYLAQPGPDDTEPVLAPKPIDTDPYRQRLLLRLATRTHYLQQVSATPNAIGAKTYRFEDYNRLRSLPAGDGRHRNVFGPEGIIESSRRTERFLLWPFGVASPGAMRQWGSHAIAFVGRRHFDDPYLLEHLLIPQQDGNH